MISPAQTAGFSKNESSQAESHSSDSARVDHVARSAPWSRREQVYQLEGQQQARSNSRPVFTPRGDDAQWN